MRHRGTTGDEIRDGAGQPAHPTTERLRPRAAPHHLKNLTHTHPLAGILPQTPRHHITQWRWQTVELRLLMHDPIRNPMRRPLTERPHSRHRERQHAPQCEHVRRRPDGVILGELLGRHEGRRADGHPRRGQRTGVTASSMEVLLSRYAKCLDGRQEIANREGFAVSRWQGVDFLVGFQSTSHAWSGNHRKTVCGFPCGLTERRR
ncbi:hypothetical protein GCM10010508_33640 [Streptomyces naganishii JCM 4654]|uniref:Uncharacterized protein n=1 Tax=Streptomyces naganishii JCM 4654 TaxID=1306179 RepID=A0A918Y4D5_9ACTN|nr:hypothetical protein GCM10010508_33640 [Streptomyces naganishii JCM 4654]